MTTIPLNEQNARQLILHTVLPELTSLRNAVATLDSSIDRLFTDFAHEIQQIRDELAGVLGSLIAENSDLKGQLQTSVDKLDSLQSDVTSAQSRLDTKSQELEANDPAPADNPSSTREIK